jgi:lipopolysaccharide biosynthesis glycosyltransferase
MNNSLPPVSLLVASDSNVIAGLAVVLQSALINLAPSRELEINLIDCGLGEPLITKLRKSLLKNRRACRLNIARPTMAQLSGVRVDEVGLFTYARLLSAELFPELKRAVYLDTDVVVNLNLAEFFDQDLEGFPVAGVQDRFTPMVSHPLSILDWEDRGMKADDAYFNAGVLLIDFDRWRSENLGAEAMRFSRENPALCVRWDQTALNVLLYQRWKQSEVKWNYMVYSNIEEESFQERANFHITGRPKQWDMAPRTNQGFQRMFFDYLDQTAWKGWRPWTPESEGRLRRWGRTRLPLVAQAWRGMKRALDGYPAS